MSAGSEHAVYQRRWVAVNGRLVSRMRQVVRPNKEDAFAVRHQDHQWGQQHQHQQQQQQQREPLGMLLRRFPVARWTVWAESGLVYRLWQHEKLGWWARSDPSIHAGGIPSWRPVVTPILLAVADGEPLTFTFCDWPPPPTDLATHQFWYDAGPIKRVAGNLRSGWPEDPPVAMLLGAPSAMAEISSAPLSLGARKPARL